MRILFIGDVFGEPGIKALEEHLATLINRHQIDFVIAQGENVSERKGLIPSDYERLKKAGVNAFTIGNHVWAKPEIYQIINQNDVIRPFNIPANFAGHGSAVFEVKGQTLRVTSLLGLEFNELRTGWNNAVQSNFFDAIDSILAEDQGKQVSHIVDFHGEVTSEKAVFGLYCDGKVAAVLGTHTHVQTADARKLPQGTLFITDAGMTGPINSAIGAAYEDVYQKMRFNAKVKFGVSTNAVQFNGVILELSPGKEHIEALNFVFE